MNASLTLEQELTVKLIAAEQRAEVAERKLTEWQKRDWQPIETAPKDRTEILVWTGIMHEICWWVDDKDVETEKGGWCFWADGYEARFTEATHWMSLPEPPHD